MRSNASWVMATWDPLDRQMDMTENITFLQLCSQSFKLRLFGEGGRGFLQFPFTENLTLTLILKEVYCIRHSNYST